MTQIDLRGVALCDIEAVRRDQLAARLVSASVDALELFGVYIGDRLGLYRFLADHGPLDAAGLAAEADISPAYARAWLEQQAVAGVVDVADGDDDDDADDGRWRRFSLGPGPAEVLVDGSSPSHTVPLAMGVAALARALPDVLDAFVTGGGVSPQRYGPELRWSIGRLSRPRYFHRLAQEWFPALPDIHTRLRTGPPARVADIGCGTGWSSIAIALAYPQVTVDGFDTDAGAVAEAALHATAHGVAERVTFRVAEPATLDAPVRYDLACAFGVLGRVGDPVGVLTALRRLAGGRGTVLVVDHHVAESFTAPGDELDRLHHGLSTLYGTPCGLSEPAGSPVGVIRPGTLRRLAHAAGFHDVSTIAINDRCLRFYRLIDRNERQPTVART